MFVHSETSSEYWKLAGQATLKEHLEKKYIKGIAKNVIFFLGDGMSIPTITAARIYSGQLKGHRGEEARLAFDKFPFTGLTKVLFEFHLSRVHNSTSQTFELLKKRRKKPKYEHYY